MDAQRSPIVNGHPDAAKAAAMRHYRALLADLGDDSTREDRDAIEMAAHVLGRTPDQVVADRAALLEARRLDGLARQVEPREFALDQARKQLDRVRAENERLAAERAAALRAATDRVNVADAEAREAREAGHRAGQLRNANPDLFD